MAQNPKTGVKLDDVSLVDDLRTISDDAANRYLEHVVVIKRSPNRQLHEALLKRLLDLTADAVEDDGVKYHLEELGKLVAKDGSVSDCPQTPSIDYRLINSRSVSS